MTSQATPAAAHGGTFVRLATVLVIAAAFTAAAPGLGHSEEPHAPTRLQAKPLPPLPGKEVFVRSKPHVNVGTGPGRQASPGGLKAPTAELHDWYCGEGSGPGGHAACTPDLIASCNGTYVPPGTNGPQQTWGMCHEKS